jgi:hypothetical protein
MQRNILGRTLQSTLQAPKSLAFARLRATKLIQVAIAGTHVES